MSVTKLWTLINTESEGEKFSWEDLSGSTLAVDSSIWLMETGQIPGVQPHLKNALSCIIALMRHNVRLVFVLEGQEKALKAATLAKRSASPVKACRTLFPLAPALASKTRELQQLLDVLGIPWMQGNGEAEALCGWLNEREFVDGVITNDCDAFLFGAKKVYRNITGNKAKEGDQRLYTMQRLQESLGTDRKGLVALAMLTGCDFTPGSLGVEVQMARKLLQHWGPQVDPIARMKKWRNDACLKQLEAFVGTKRPPHCRRCALNTQNEKHKCKGRKTDCQCTWHTSKAEADYRKLELDVRRKALQDPDFLNEKIVDAFLSPNEEKNFDFCWRQPQWEKLTALSSGFGSEKGQKNLLPLVTAWITNFSKDSLQSLAEPINIVRTRQQNNHPVYEVWWEAKDAFPSALLAPGEKGFVSQENQSVFQRRFPLVVEAFKEAALHKSIPIKKRKSLAVDPKQTKITSMLSVRKRLRFSSCNSPKKRPLTSPQGQPLTPPLPQLKDFDDDIQFKSFIEAKNSR